MVKTISELTNHRADGRKFPVNFPEGWTPLTVAIWRFGSDLLMKDTKDWGWQHWYFAIADGTAQYDIEEMHELQRPEAENRLAYIKRHRREVADRFSAACVNGELVTGYSVIGGGGVTSLEPDLWRTDDPYLRFKSFSFDPVEPFSERLDLPCWLWVDSSSLRAACDLLRRERNGWGPPISPPPLPRTESFINDEGQREIWSWNEAGVLSVQRDEVEVPKPGRPAARPRIFSIFAEHLRKGDVAERASWEGKAIAAEWLSNATAAPRDLKPPKASTCEDRIRDFYNMIERGADGRSIVNVAQILQAMNYPINPDKSRAIG